MNVIRVNSPTSVHPSPFQLLRPSPMHSLLITSRLDYCNSFMCGSSSKTPRLQPEFCCLSPHTLLQLDHVKPVLQNLHWLLILQRTHNFSPSPTKPSTIWLPPTCLSSSTSTPTCTLRSQTRALCIALPPSATHSPPHCPTSRNP